MQCKPYFSRYRRTAVIDRLLETFCDPEHAGHAIRKHADSIKRNCCMLAHCMCHILGTSKSPKEDDRSQSVNRHQVLAKRYTMVYIACQKYRGRKTSDSYGGAYVVNRTFGIHRHLYIHTFLLEIFGSIYYDPPGKGSTFWLKRFLNDRAP